MCSNRSTAPNFLSGPIYTASILHDNTLATLPSAHNRCVEQTLSYRWSIHNGLTSPPNDCQLRRLSGWMQERSKDRIKSPVLPQCRDGTSRHLKSPAVSSKLFVEEKGSNSVELIVLYSYRELISLSSTTRRHNILKRSLSSCLRSANYIAYGA